MPAGRPSEFKPEYVQLAAQLCAQGATDVELADEFGISVRTLYSWRAKYPEFLQAIKLNKEIADERVEGMLFRRATGYSFESVKIFCGKDGQVTQVPYIEHVPPDTTACIFWLKNRQPKQWRDKQEQEHTGLDGGPIQLVSSIPRPKEGE